MKAQPLPSLPPPAGWRQIAGWAVQAQAVRRLYCTLDLVDCTGRGGISMKVAAVGGRVAARLAIAHGGTCHLQHWRSQLQHQQHGCGRPTGRNRWLNFEGRGIFDARGDRNYSQRARGESLFSSNVEESDETTGDTPLMAAARRGDDASCVSALLDLGASVRARNKVSPTYVISSTKVLE